jgi:hypothetical protein
MISLGERGSDVVKRPTRMRWSQNSWRWGAQGQLDDSELQEALVVCIARPKNARIGQDLDEIGLYSVESAGESTPPINPRKLQTKAALNQTA